MDNTGMVYTSKVDTNPSTKLCSLTLLMWPPPLPLRQTSQQLALPLLFH